MSLTEGRVGPFSRSTGLVAPSLHTQLPMGEVSNPKDKM